LKGTSLHGLLLGLWSAKVKVRASGMDMPPNGDYIECQREGQPWLRNNLPGSPAIVCIGIGTLETPMMPRGAQLDNYLVDNNNTKRLKSKIFIMNFNFKINFKFKMEQLTKAQDITELNLKLLT
jgi:hypothetical protein